jgi:hypothetical protein
MTVILCCNSTVFHIYGKADRSQNCQPFLFIFTADSRHSKPASYTPKTNNYFKEGKVGHDEREKIWI